MYTGDHDHDDAEMLLLVEVQEAIYSETGFAPITEKQVDALIAEAIKTPTTIKEKNDA